MIAPHFDAMSKEFSGAIFVKVDVDAQGEVRTVSVNFSTLELQHGESNPVPSPDARLILGTTLG